MVRVAAVEASILHPTMPPVLADLWNRVNRLATRARSSSPRLSTCSSLIDNKEDKENIAGQGLEEEPPPDTRALVGAPGFSILS
jgi:hypothetical protein